MPQRVSGVSSLADGCYDSGVDGSYDETAGTVIFAVFVVELKGLLPRGRIERIFHDHEEFVGLG